MIRIEQGDITKLVADAIVNAANQMMLGKCAVETCFGYQESWIIRNLKTLRMATFPHPQCLRA